MRNGKIFALLLALSATCAGSSLAAQDKDSAAQTQALNTLQALDRKMLDTRGTPEYMAAHDAFARESLKLAQGPDVRVIPDDDDSDILARLQSLSRGLGANPPQSEAYAKVHEEFVVLLKTLGRRNPSPASR